MMKNQITDLDQPRKRVGRPPLANVAMSEIQRKHRSRAKLRQGGQKEYWLSLRGPHLDTVERLAVANGISVANVLTALVGEALARVSLTLWAAEKAGQGGATIEELQTVIDREFLSQTTAEYKEQREKGAK